MPTLNLTLKSPSVGTFPVEIEDDETVEALAVVAYSLKPELGEDLRLVYKGKVLKQEQELKVAGIENGAAIAIARKVAGTPATAAVVAPKAAAPSAVSATPDVAPLVADTRAGAVHLTGFGPFAGHSVNASWEVVRALGQSLPSLEVGGCEYAVLLPESPVQVAYSAVDSIASAGHYGAAPPGPNLPIRLVMHVGVGQVGPMRLESRARNSGYAMPDVCGRWCADAGSCVQGGPPGLQTSLDLSKVCAQAQASGCPAELQISSDAGLYLCEYIFYKSLHTALSSGGGPAVLFVHVPPLGQPYSLEQLVASLRVVLKACLEQCVETLSAPLPSAAAAAAVKEVNAAAGTPSAGSAVQAIPRLGDRMRAVRDHSGLPAKWQKGEMFVVDSVKANGFVRLCALNDQDRVVGVLLHLWGGFFCRVESSPAGKVEPLPLETKPAANTTPQIIPASAPVVPAQIEADQHEEPSIPASIPASTTSPTSGAAPTAAEEMPITSEALLGAAHLLETGELSPAEAAKLMRRTAMQVEEFKLALGEMGQALQMVNFVSARTLRNIGVAAQDAGVGGAGQAVPSQPVEREENTRSFLLKKGDADVQEMHRRANEPKLERNISTGSGSTCNWGGTAAASAGSDEKPKTREEMDKAREDRLKRLEAQQEQKKKQLADADEKAKSRDAMFNKPFVGPTKQLGEH